MFFLSDMCTSTIYLQILTPFMLRRVKTDVDLMIPPKKELIVYAPMTKEQQEFYTATVDRTILQKIEEKNVNIAFITYFRMNLSWI